MKKVLALLFLFGLVLGVSAGTTPLLIEAFQIGIITIPEAEPRSDTAVEMTFSIDSLCYVQFTAGGKAMLARLKLELNGEDLPPPDIRVETNGMGEEVAFSMVYTILLDPGEHNLALFITRHGSSGTSTLCSGSYLQALIFVPDEDAGVAEPPEYSATGQEVGSVVTRGPYVNVAGASQLVNGTGRVMEGAIEADRVRVSALPPGTYFARDGEKTVVKIVKVD